MQLELTHLELLENLHFYIQHVTLTKSGGGLFFGKLFAANQKFVSKRMFMTRRPHQHKESKAIGWYPQKGQREDCTCSLTALGLHMNPPSPLAPSGGLNKGSPYSQRGQGCTSEIPTPFDKYPMLEIKIDVKLFNKALPPTPSQCNIIFLFLKNVNLK